ncbi:MAG: hypothetical protein HYT87_12745 [Nitrospirae bacterium]|nr:hypothetical protein [Nitrospirota bacterium]
MRNLRYVVAGVAASACLLWDLSSASASESPTGVAGDLVNLCYSFLNPTCLGYGLEVKPVVCPATNAAVSYYTPRFIVEIVNKPGEVLLGEPFSYLVERALEEVQAGWKTMGMGVIGGALGALSGRSAEMAALGAGTGALLGELGLERLGSGESKYENGSFQFRREAHVYELDWDPYSMLELDQNCEPRMIPDYPLIYPVYLSELDFWHWSTGLGDFVATDELAFKGKTLATGVPRALLGFKTLGPYGPAYPTYGEVEDPGNEAQGALVLALRAVQRSHDLGLPGLSMGDVRRVLLSDAGKLGAGTCVDPNMDMKDMPAHMFDFSKSSALNMNGWVLYVYEKRTHCVDKATWRCGVGVAARAIGAVTGPKGYLLVEGGARWLKSAEVSMRVKEFSEKVIETYREYRKYIKTLLKLAGVVISAYTIYRSVDEIRQMSKTAGDEKAAREATGKDGVETVSRANRVRSQSERCAGLAAGDRESCLKSEMRKEECQENTECNSVSREQDARIKGAATAHSRHLGGGRYEISDGTQTTIIQLPVAPEATQGPDDSSSRRPRSGAEGNDK